MLIHINNTNPILDEDSPQRANPAHGIGVSHDGMEYACEQRLSIEHIADLTRRSDLPPWSKGVRGQVADKGTSYHIYHPFHIMMAEGSSRARVARLGRQPLLPDRDPGEGRGDHVELPDREIRCD